MSLPPTTTAELFYAWFQPAGTTDSRLNITMQPLLNCYRDVLHGALTASASPYMPQLYVAPSVSLMVDNFFFLYRQDVMSQTSPPPRGTAFCERDHAGNGLLSSPLRQGRSMCGRQPHGWPVQVGVFPDLDIPLAILAERPMHLIGKLGKAMVGI